MDTFDARNLPDDMGDDERKAVEHAVRMTHAIMDRCPSPKLLDFFERRIAQGETIEAIEAKTENIPDELERDAALENFDLPEPAAKLHRRLFIALNWRNN